MDKDNDECCRESESIDTITIDDDKETITLGDCTLKYDDYICLAEQCPLYKELQALKYELYQHRCEINKHRRIEIILVTTKCLIIIIATLIHLTL